MSIMRSVIRGGAVRFLAGIGACFAVWYPAARIMNGISFGPERLVAFLNLTLCLTGGYVVSLGAMRPTLHAAQGIESRRSIIAGCLAMWILLLIDFLFQLGGQGLGMLYGTHTSRSIMELVAFLVGAGTTFVAFKSWLKEGEQELKEMMDSIDRIAPSAVVHGARAKEVASERVGDQ